MLTVKGYIWAGCGDGVIRIFDMHNTTLLEQRSVKSKCGGIYDMKAIDDTVVWTVYKDQLICIWSTMLKKSQPIKKIQALFFTTLVQVESEVWLGSIEGNIHIYDSKNYKQKKELACEGQSIGYMITNGRRVWIAMDQFIMVYNSTTCKPTKRLEGHNKPINSMFVSRVVLLTVSQVFGAWKGRDVELFK